MCNKETIQGTLHKSAYMDGKNVYNMDLKIHTGYFEIYMPEYLMIL